jgi:hypothetical protein
LSISLNLCEHDSGVCGLALGLQLDELLHLPLLNTGLNPPQLQQVLLSISPIAQLLIRQRPQQQQIPIPSESQPLLRMPHALQVLAAVVESEGQAFAGGQVVVFLEVLAEVEGGPFVLPQGGVGLG